MNLLLYIVCAVAVWRVTHLFSKEDGPFEVIYLLRKQLGQGFFGNLLDCFYCLSIWVSIAPGIWLGKDWKEKIVYWLALSGAACLLEKLSSQESVHPPEYFEDEKK